MNATGYVAVGRRSPRMSVGWSTVPGKADSDARTTAELGDAGNALE